jgi:non-specific serine/threonine protein kinase
MAQQARRLGRCNLPAELTSFVGRRQELREVKRLLTVTRLLTRTGSGGRARIQLSRWVADAAKPG